MRVKQHQARCELEAYIPIININKSTLSDPKTASLYYAWVAEDEFLHNALMSISVIRDCLMTKYGEHFESLFDRIVDTSKKMI